MNTNWDEFWNSFIKANELENKVSEMDQIDQGPYTKDTCFDIFNDYQNYSKELVDIKHKLVDEFELLPGVHLHTSRIKETESVLRKVVEKRYSNFFNIHSAYATITGSNYREVLTDLIGIRLIISYRGLWRDLHNEIVRKFPYHQKLNTCHEGEFVPHEAGNQFLAEIPKAYFAYEDDLSIYDGIRIEKKLRENGYRSVHYILSYKGVYVELQTRTIYDEAWSDCDHSYVYKHDENKSHAALQVMSKILCEYTNASNDYGDLMKHIYDQSPIFDAGVAKFITSADVKDEIKKLLDRFSRAQIELKQLLDNIHVEEGGVSGV